MTLTVRGIPVQADELTCSRWFSTPDTLRQSPFAASGGRPRTRPVIRACAPTS